MTISGSVFLIVEDEMIIAETIREILEREGCKEIMMADSVEEAQEAISTKRPTLVLTDIALGKDKTGIDLGNLLISQYKIPFIYITSHYSPDILEKAKHTRPNAYIVKPFKNQDLVVAIELALFNIQQTPPGTDLLEELTVKEGRAIVHIPYTNIRWFETDGNYTTINLVDNKRRVIRKPLSELQEQLPSSAFIRIHKSFLVNKKYISEIRASHIVVGTQELPVGRTYQQALSDLAK